MSPRISMDRFKSWIAGSNVAGKENRSRPPPPLRTSNVYDHDDAFRNVALNLLARHGALDLSVEETIEATLIDSEQRTAFLESLIFRKYQLRYLCPEKGEGEGDSAPSSFGGEPAFLVHQIDQLFGNALKAMLSSSECKNINSPSSTTDTTLSSTFEGTTLVPSEECQIAVPQQTPVTPRNKHDLIISPVAASSGYRSPRPTKRKSKRTKLTLRQRFFPESDPRSRRKIRARNAKVRNIDWQLTTAVQQVVSLNLDNSMEIQSEKKIQRDDYKPPSPLSISL